MKDWETVAAFIAFAIASVISMTCYALGWITDIIRY